MKDFTIHEQKLLEEQAQLVGELSDIAVYNDQIGQWEPLSEEQEGGPESDLNDLADRAEEFEDRTNMVKTLGKRLTDVEHALLKFAAGTYGICEVTGEEIEADRLLANPAARTNKAHMNE